MQGKEIRDVTEPANIRIRHRFHVQNPSDADADLLRDQNYQLF